MTITERLLGLCTINCHRKITTYKPYGFSKTIAERLLGMLLHTCFYFLFKSQLTMTAAERLQMYNVTM